jgi:hypothetical protein
VKPAPTNLWNSLREAVVDCALALVVLVFAALLLCSNGCATASQPLPAGVRDGEAKAVTIVWRVYGRTDVPPVVRWKQGAALDCTDPNSGRPGFPVWLVEDGEPRPGCREGFTMSFLECSVAWHEGDSFSSTAMAHELLHVAQARVGVLDSNHRRPEWQTLLPRALEALQEAGL